MITNGADVFRDGLTQEQRDWLSARTTTVFTPANMAFGGSKIERDMVIRDEYTGRDALRWLELWSVKFLVNLSHFTAEMFFIGLDMSPSSHPKSLSSMECRQQYQKRLENILRIWYMTVASVTLILGHPVISYSRRTTQ